MAVRPDPTARLYQNPWQSTLPDHKLLELFQEGAKRAEDVLADWMSTGQVEEGRDSYACVILDPTRRRHQRTIQQRVLAIILLGPNAERYIPNGAAKADAHDRLGQPNGELVKKRSFCLSDHDFAYGDSAVYEGAIAGGSGLSVQQDRFLAFDVLEYTMKRVRAIRDGWLTEMRRTMDGQRWYNTSDEPGPEYADVAKMTQFITG